MKSASRVSTLPSWSTSAFVSVYGAIGRPTADVTTISASLARIRPSPFTSPNVPNPVQNDADTGVTATPAKVPAAVSLGLEIVAGEEPEATSIWNVRLASVITPPAPAGLAPASSRLPGPALAALTVAAPNAPGAVPT